MQGGGLALCFNIDAGDSMIDSHPVVDKSAMRELCSWSLLWAALGNVMKQKPNSPR